VIHVVNPYVLRSIAFHRKEARFISLSTPDELRSQASSAERTRFQVVLRTMFS
jgi:hypothetical protein